VGVGRGGHGGRGIVSMANEFCRKSAYVHTAATKIVMALLMEMTMTTTVMMMTMMMMGNGLQSTPSHPLKPTSTPIPPHRCSHFNWHINKFHKSFAL